jgi:Domain of unknown function (DUF4124)
MTPLCANLGARRLAILLASVIFVCPVIYASAELYEWVDEKGQRNFTDNPNNVPGKYRGKATVSPGLQASPETIRRDAERRRQEDLASAAQSRQREFHQAAEACAEDSGVEIIPKPGTRVTVKGTTQEKFDFEKCMTARGQSTERAR